MNGTFIQIKHFNMLTRRVSAVPLGNEWPRYPASVGLRGGLAGSRGAATNFNIIIH